uniref:Methyltransferase domain-containing protein n=1 Tax=candidate division WOR-3 bacterium TaxID=2052148 RepID=A0A7C4YGS1_UNCW3
MISIKEEIQDKILEMIGLKGLKSDNVHIFEDKIQNIRNKLVKLSLDLYRKEFFIGENEIAYISYNFPMNIGKTMYIMNLLKNFSQIEKKDFVKVIDIGCGEGAGSIGISLSLKNNISFTGVDISEERLNYYKEFMDFLKCNFDIKRISSFKVIDSIKEFDIVIMSNILCEIEDSNSFVNKIVKSMKDEGIMIIIEPALRETSKNIMRIKEDLKDKGFLLPCLKNKTCPLLLKDEWCYSMKKWEVPFFIQVINRKLFRDLRLKFSYLAFVKERINIDKFYYFIDETKNEKGRLKNFICGENSLVECILLKKNISKNNILFKSIEKGDIISLNNFIKRKDILWEINKGTKIKIL